MSSFTSFTFLVRFFLLAGVFMNSLCIPIYQSIHFINDNTFEIVENNWMENQEEEDEDKREKKENKKIEYQITLQNKNYFSGNSNSLFDVATRINYQFQLEIPFPPPDTRV